MRDHEELEAEIRELDKEERERLLRLIKQMIRARQFGFAVHFDEQKESFFLIDLATSTVAAPTPMNLAAVTAWLDDYEREAAE